MGRQDAIVTFQDGADLEPSFLDFVRLETCTDYPRKHRTTNNKIRKPSRKHRTTNNKIRKPSGSLWAGRGIEKAYVGPSSKTCALLYGTCGYTQNSSLILLLYDRSVYLSSFALPLALFVPFSSLENLFLVFT